MSNNGRIGNGPPKDLNERILDVVKDRMRKKGLVTNDIGALLGLSKGVTLRRLRGQTHFKVPEIEILMNELSFTLFDFMIQDADLTKEASRIAAASDHIADSVKSLRAIASHLAALSPSAGPAPNGFMRVEYCIAVNASGSYNVLGWDGADREDLEHLAGWDDGQREVTWRSVYVPVPAGSRGRRGKIAAAAFREEVEQWDL